MSKGEESSLIKTTSSSSSAAPGVGAKSVSAIPTSILNPSGYNKPLVGGVDSTDSSVATNSGSGFFTRTRMFGAWLTKATGGDRANISSKDINAIAPSSF